MRCDHDHNADDDIALLQAELCTVYAQLEHVSALAAALQGGLRGLLDALDAPRYGRPARSEHLLLALREARTALRQASAHLEEE